MGAGGVGCRGGREVLLAMDGAAMVEWARAQADVAMAYVTSRGGAVGIARDAYPYATAVLASIALFNVSAYLFPLFVSWMYSGANLKRRYGAEWAVVTGSSSGIGKAIAMALARQGISVVLVALDDQLLSATFKELKKAFPAVAFRKVGVNLAASDGSYMGPIAEATAHIKVQLLFNNAGYIKTSFFHLSDLGAQLANLECNATSAVRITHHFYQRMMRDGMRGGIVFTSSAAGFIPSPFASMYGATKAFISEFSACLAVEAKASGIDVVAVHPSPVNSNFLRGAADLDMFKKAYAAATGPDSLPGPIFGALACGITPWRDIGTFAIFMRIVMKILDFSFMTWGFALAAPLMPDYKNNMKKAN